MIREFYSVETIDGRKYIHLQGTLAPAPDADTPYMALYPVSCIIPIDDANNESNSERAALYLSTAQQVCQPATQAEHDYLRNRFYAGTTPGKQLDIDNVTMSTPEGDYHYDTCE